ncbi:MAG: nucleoside triphosphate pyrophosphohydrolase [Bacteroidetes bacterium]|nr:nucleoside triphosphate pyrophosphohydrolase [Bacteroidota bacterium]MBS1629158.1 nucleoside triphosphate pyrophosphohydrolase [Bacteroidota bacterium]
MPYYNSLERLLRIMSELRQSCPWDKKQTIESLRPLTIEETYELAGAITEGDWQGLKEESGDILLHLVFYALIAEEQQQYRFEDVLESICNKLVQRHPHIYASTKVESDEDVKRNWEQIKLKEGKRSILAGVPAALPALVKALRLQEKTRTVGFEWEHISQVRAKVDEEISELFEAVDEGQQEHIEEEFGDVLFSLVNYARFANIDPEAALEKTNRKFIRRFQGMEKWAEAHERNLREMSLEEQDALWNEMKIAEREPGI